ncbi:piggyBac transposable element-derived protein 4 [Amia ocellicauda]|uniref:piggyBac transposable element-derived protein 4 n=1 Tax=Amia ocellicauda TaxID=2972642 RepID=UPI00346406CB
MAETDPLEGAQIEVELSESDDDWSGAEKNTVEQTQALEEILESDEDLSGAETFVTDEEFMDQNGEDSFDERTDDSDDPTYAPSPPSTPSTSEAASSPSPKREAPSPRSEAPSPRSEAPSPRSEAPSPRRETRGTPSSRRGPSSGRKAGTKRCRLSTQSPRSRSPHRTTPGQYWKTETDPDVAPTLPRFQPARTPGVQLDKSKTYSPLELFQLFFSPNVVRVLCSNTNKQATKRIAQGLQFKWTDVTPQEFLKYLSLVIFMGLLKLGSVKAYWRNKHIFCVPFPKTVMSRDRWRFISSNLHMSDPAKDAVNDGKKGTSEHDPLFRLKPLMTEIQTACKSFYQPRKNLSIDERMVATKAKTGMTQYIKDKPTRWGFKLFILADSYNGYTTDFTVYTGKGKFPTGLGLSYDAVVGLLDKPYLGNGYHVYCDNFYTSPHLFRHLLSKGFGACGTYRLGMKDSPNTKVNALTSKSQRGSIRWIREGDLLFVKWMDSREVSMCSTIHQVYSSNRVMRKLKKKDGTWEAISIPIPTTIVEYNKYMGGVDLSDQLIQYTTAHHKVMRWYKTMFLHFVDIATVNSYLLHKELCEQQKTKPLTHRGFMELLTAQLAGVTLDVVSVDRQTNHTPLPIAPLDPEKPKHRPADVRKYCLHCKRRKKYNKTPWQCGACLVPLCNFLERPCFAQWHAKGTLKFQGQ